MAVNLRTHAAELRKWLPSKSIQNDISVCERWSMSSTTSFGGKWPEFPGDLIARKANDARCRDSLEKVVPAGFVNVGSETREDALLLANPFFQVSRVLQVSCEGFRPWNCLFVKSVKVSQYVRPIQTMD